MISRSAIIRSSVVTLLSLAFLTISINGVSVLSLFSPLEGDSDFQLSDLYTKVADRRPVSQCSDDVVVVATDGCRRSDIVDLIAALETFSPAAIGVDVNFRYPSEDDTRMIEVFDACENLTLPLILSQDSDGETFQVDENENSFLTSWLDSERFSVVNLERYTMWGSVRTFRPTYSTPEGVIPGFALRLAFLADPEKAEAFTSRKHDSEYINYPSRTFEVLEPGDIINEDGSLDEGVKNSICGRVVILGDLDNSKDVFPVPHKEMMPGVMIHAHCVDTILAGRGIDSMPMWLNIVLSVILCFVFALLHLSVERRLDNGVDFVMRVFQILLMFALYWLGCVLYIRNYYVDMSLVLLMVVTSALSMDICSGVAQILSQIINRFKK